MNREEVKEKKIDHEKGQWVDTYLNILGLIKEEPSMSYLERICTAHLTTFPFENISKLIYYRDQPLNQFMIPPLHTFIKNFQQHHLSGTCYTLNKHLLSLLKGLGFEAYYVMLGKVHIGIIVTVDGKRHYVDVGSAAPIFKSIDLDQTGDKTAEFGNDQVRIEYVDEAKGLLQYVRWTDGEQRGSIWDFDVNKAYEYGDFNEIITNSNQPNTMFMSMLRCQLWQLDQNRSVSLANNVFGIRYVDGRTEKTTLQSVAEIENVLSDEFRLPKLPVSEAIDILRSLDVDIFSKQ